MSKSIDVKIKVILQLNCSTARIKRHWCVVVVVVGSRWQGRGRLLILELFTIPVSGYIIGAGLIASYICKYFMQVLDLLLGFSFPACTCLWNLVANFQRVSIKCLKSTLNFDCFSWVSVYNALNKPFMEVDCIGQLSRFHSIINYGTQIVSLKKSQSAANIWNFPWSWKFTQNTN